MKRAEIAIFRSAVSPPIPFPLSVPTALSLSPFLSPIPARPPRALSRPSPEIPADSTLRLYFMLGKPREEATKKSARATIAHKRAYHVKVSRLGRIII